MKLVILVGDICGKRMSAALLMAYIQGLLRSHVPFVEEAHGELMNSISRSMHRVTADDKFASLFIGIYDEDNCLLTYVNAGHDPLVLFRLPAAKAGGGRPIPPTPSAATPLEAVRFQNGGLLLGVDPNFEYHTSTQKLRDGDVFICDTDG